MSFSIVTDGSSKHPTNYINGPIGCEEGRLYYGVTTRSVYLCVRFVGLAALVVLHTGNRTSDLTGEVVIDHTTVVLLDDSKTVHLSNGVPDLMDEPEVEA